VNLKNRSIQFYFQKTKGKSIKLKSTLNFINEQRRGILLALRHKVQNYIIVFRFFDGFKKSNHI
jgi:hypothetical protein